MAAVVTFLGFHHSPNGRKDGSTQWLGRILWPIRKYLTKRKPVATFKFKTLDGDDVLEHRIEARAVWESDRPLENVQLVHRSNRVSPYVFSSVEGHTFEFCVEDFNGDGVPELAVTFHCGAHTRVIQVFAFDHAGMLRLIPGAEIGSDWPEISWDDKDGDGKKEIYVKQRNWSGEPAAESIDQKYVFRNGAYAVDNKRITTGSSGRS